MGTVDNSPFNLPKDYLSYSAIDLWRRSPAQFRKRYYEKQRSFTTPELAFGKHIADLLENGDESVAHIKQYVKPEQQIDIDIEGVKVFGFIDSYDPDTFSFIEFKTGKKPWTQERVDNHLQLDIYSLAIETIFGEVNDECHLIWMQTENIEPQKTGLITHENSHKIQLTGDVHEFARTINKKQRGATKDLIIDTAKAVSEDYTKWQAANPPAKPRVGLIPK